MAAIGILMVMFGLPYLLITGFFKANHKMNKH